MKDSKKSKPPKTEIDVRFIDMIEKVKVSKKIKSDRLMSKALGLHANFISRIKTGVQSVPSTVWDRFHLYLEENDVVSDNLSASPLEHAESDVAEDKAKQALREGLEKDEYVMVERTLYPFDFSRRSHNPLTGAERAYESSLQRALKVANDTILLLTNHLADKERTIQILLGQQPKND